jgi:FlaG/FlaF family flagellin (archaellin)
VTGRGVECSNTIINYYYRSRVALVEIVNRPTGERAVTPAVALLVMVAVSVLLAAVVGFLLFGGGGGGGGGQSAEPTANLTFESIENGTSVSVTVDDPGDVDSIEFSTTCGGSAPETMTDPAADDSAVVAECSSGDTVTAIGVGGGQSKLLRKYEHSPG